MKSMIGVALAIALVGGAAGAQDRDHGRPGGHPGQAHGPAPSAPHGGPQPVAPPPHGGPLPAFAPRRGPLPAPAPSRSGARGPEPGFRPGGFLHDRGWRGGSRFHAPLFRYPPGWGYRTWAFGSFLPGVFLTPDFTIWKYWTYGLPAPPPGYHWIRLGPDALLVRYGDGYVLDAAYGLFS